MENKIAKIISVILFPLLFPSYIILILFYFNNFNSYQVPLNAKFMVFTIILITTCLFPILFIFIMKRRGMINSIQMETKEERVFPLIITTIFFSMAYYMLRNIEVLEIFLFFLIGSIFLMILTLLVNFVTKISVHMIGVGAFTGGLIGIALSIHADLVFLIIISLFFSGLTGYARLKLKAHNQLQIYSGFLSGLLIMLAIFMM